MAESTNGTDGRSYSFRLFISSNTPNSRAAVENFRIAAGRLLGENGYTLETIDVILYPRLAAEYGIQLVPSLQRLLPTPVAVMTGTLTDTPQLESFITGT